MRREHFDLPTVSALSLAGICGILWCVSYVGGISLTRSISYWSVRGTGGGTLFDTAHIIFARGVLEISWTPQSVFDRFPISIDGTYWHLRWQMGQGTSLLWDTLRGDVAGVPGLVWRRGPDRTVIYLSWWVPLGAVLVLLTRLLIGGVRAARRRAQNICAICGYDLRATPQRCPECGTSVANSAAKPRAPVSVE